MAEAAAPGASTCSKDITRSPIYPCRARTQLPAPPSCRYSPAGALRLELQRIAHLVHVRAGTADHIFDHQTALVLDDPGDLQQRRTDRHVEIFDGIGPAEDRAEGLLGGIEFDLLAEQPEQRFLF